MAKVPLDSDRIFSQTVSGQPKSEVLAMLQERHPGTQYHFIEDKMGTLEKVGTASSKTDFLTDETAHGTASPKASGRSMAWKVVHRPPRYMHAHTAQDVGLQVCKVPELEAWQLYLVDWGYNTPEERRRAEENPRIQLLSLGDSFAKATGTG